MYFTKVYFSSQQKLSPAPFYTAFELKCTFQNVFFKSVFFQRIILKSIFVKSVYFLSVFFFLGSTNFGPRTMKLKCTFPKCILRCIFPKWNSSVLFKSAFQSFFFPKWIFVKQKLWPKRRCSFLFHCLYLTQANIAQPTYDETKRNIYITGDCLLRQLTSDQNKN